MNDADQINGHPGRSPSAEFAHASSPAALKPKGACWYCNLPLDNVRRFCSKSCADDYRIEEAFSNGEK